jgi:AcrR family transcriptional regulator
MPKSRAIAEPAAGAETTQAALLTAATAVFAESGYFKASVREIARRAGANLAAVSYHFGGKQGLYLAMLQQLAQAGLARYPLATEESAALPREERLVQAVRNFLSRFMGPAPVPVLPRLLVQEFAHPTPALDVMIRRLLRPQVEQLTAIVREFLGPRATPVQARRAVFSIAGQCLIYLLGRPIVERLAPEVYDDEAEFEAAIRHIADFSIAGLQSLRRQIDREWTE